MERRDSVDLGPTNDCELETRVQLALQVVDVEFEFEVVHESKTVDAA